MVKKSYITAKNVHDKYDKWMEELKYFKNGNRKFNINNSALLVIDMQNYFLSEDSHAFVPSAPFIISSIKKTIVRFREIERPVFFTTFAVGNDPNEPIRKWWNDVVLINSNESEIVTDLKPMDEEDILIKPTYDAFYRTDLSSKLEEKGIEQLLITGVLTNFCCETTAREAFCRGYDVFALVDGMATYSEQEHIHTLKSMAYGFATPILSCDV